MTRDSFVLYQDESGQPVSCAVLTVGSGRPHVVLTALQHGDEILSLETGIQVLEQLKKQSITGTVTLLTCLNPIGFRDGSRSLLSQTNELSSNQTNLNRVHPGDAAGSLAERIAAATDTYITGLDPDYVIDL